MLKFVVKRPRDGSTAAAAEPPKRARVPWGVRDPLTFVVWNCNGLPVRLTAGDKPEILTFLAEHAPDVFCLGEVRAAAACGTPGARKGDGAPRDHGRIGATGETQRKDKQVLDAFLEEVREDYCAYYSLAEYKYAGTAVLVRKSAVCKPKSVRYNADLEAEDKVHHPEGRVIFMEWDSVSLLHLYAPNNGWQPKGFQRRELWDADMKAFLAHQRSQSRSPVLFCGDLNVAPLDCDLSHPAYFKKQVKSTPIRPPSHYVGQPGCTPRERESFAAIVEAAGLVDLYREKNPADPAADIMGPHFSWRGNISADGGGRYGGKGMRIDHFLSTKEVLDRVVSCVICGFGADREGFMGSDHSPMKLVLAAAEETATKPE